jgi:hypothetical protein
MPVIAQILLVLIFVLAGAGITYEGITHHYIPLLSGTTPTATPPPYLLPTDTPAITLTPTKTIYQTETSQGVDNKAVMLVGLNNCLNNAYVYYTSQMNKFKAQGFYDDPDEANKTQNFLDYQYNQLQQECFSLYRPK